MQELEARGSVSGVSANGGSSLRQLFVFMLDELRFALFLSVVDTVVRSVEITPLPKAPEIVRGVVNLRGAVIPVFDVRKRFRLPARDTLLSDQLLVARASSRRTVALLVDAVSGVIECPEEEIVATTKVHPDIEYVEGVIKLDRQLVLIHNLAKFLSLDEDMLLDAALKQDTGEVA